MTTIKSTVSPGRMLGVESVVGSQAELLFEIRDGRTYEAIYVSRAALLAALDAVPGDALAGSEDCRLATEKKLAEAETELEAWKHTVSVLDDELRDSQELLGQRAVELHKARAERDALAKTVERVRKLTECGAHSLLPETIRAALDPEPAFVLPTEVPAWIEAKRDFHGYTTTLTLWTDGTNQFWRSEHDGEDWKPAGVIECFTGHRLLTADGGAE